LSLLGSGGAWIAIVHSQTFAEFNPGSLTDMCSALGSAAALSPERVWLASRQMFFDGLLMVLAMMLPGAVRGTAFTPACCAHKPWPVHSAWMAAYLAAWCAGLLAAVFAVGTVSWLGWPGRSALPAGMTVQALALCAALMHCHRLLAPTEAALRAAPPLSSRAAWHAGLREGGRCIRRCALPMVALHVLYGMSLTAMAAYALWFWWRADAPPRWPHAVAALAFLGSAVAV
jgi:hypothetical protein